MDSNSNETNQQPLNPGRRQAFLDPDTKNRVRAKKCILGTSGCCCGLFVVAWIVQGFAYLYATRGCSLNKEYTYPGGGTSALGGPEFNLVPRIALLAQRKRALYGQAFDVIPSNEASSLSDAPTGVWWRTWGPFFNTYTYEDVASSVVTFYMRRKLLRLGLAHAIERCDGKGPSIVFSEGLAYFGNRIRRMLGMNQAYTIYLYSDGELVSTVQETTVGTSSMSFRNSTAGLMASAVLKNRHFHGEFDLWLVKNELPAQLPFWVANGAAALFAYSELGVPKAKTTPESADDEFLAAARVIPADGSDEQLA